MIILAVDGSLNFDTSIDTKGFSNGTKSISNSLGRLKSALGKVAVAVAAAFSVKQIIDFGKQAIETASDMAEVQNVVDTAFGSMSDKMEEFADTSIKQFGISKLAAKQTGSTFMAMASGMGLAQDNASDMAIALTGLSADMASFYNVSQDVASTALKSIFTGETETLKQFGIVMTDANLQAYALSQGINKSTQNMSQAEKVQLRYNYVMQQTSLAQGDFAKTQDSWANQTRILSEQWKEFGTVVGQLLMQVLLPAVRTLNNALSALIDYARQVTQALSEAFGIDLASSTGSSGALAQDTADLADNAEQAASSYDDMAQAAETAQEANENSLASFDQMNKLSDNSNNSSSSSSTVPALSGAGGNRTMSIKAEADTADAENKFTRFFDKLKEKCKNAFKPFKEAWDKYGSALIESAKEEFKNLWDLIKSIGKSYAEVWENGTGEKIVGNILQIFTNINRIIGNISAGLSKAWEKNNTGTQIIQSIADIFNDILEDINRITDDIADWAEELDFSPILTEFKDVLKEIEPLIDSIGDMVEDTVKGIVLPAVKLVIEVIAPAALNTVKSALAAINALIEPIKNNLSYINEKVVKPLVSSIGGILKTALDKISETFQMIADKVNEHAPQIQTVIQGISDILGVIISVLKETLLPAVEYVFSIAKNAIGGFIDTILNIIDGLSAVISFVKDVFSGDWGAAWQDLKDLFYCIFIVPFKNLWNELTGFFSSWWETVKNVFSNLTTWFKDKFSSAYNAVKDVFSGIGTWFGNRWNDIKKVFSNVKTWFGDIFKGAWDNIKSVFSNVGDFFSGIWNGITSGFKGFINGIIDGINWLIAQINSISISAPDWDWLPDNIQGKSWGFNIPEIPRLAQGAVIPPNSEFLAVLGDQKRGTNIEAPLDTIKQALLEALTVYSGSGGNQKISVTIPIEVKGRVLSQIVIDDINDYIKRNGKSPINV